MLYQMKEWCTLTGHWHTGFIDSFAGDRAAWYHPARILGISPASFLSLVIKDYKPDEVIVLGRDGDNPGFIFSWESQSAMRRYKNFINRKAREINYQV